MWDVTAWALVTWLKSSALLALLVGVCWLAFEQHSGAFALAVIAAVLGELHISRQVVREWRHEAGYRWWWSS
jgi:hypothetical protein